MTEKEGIVHEEDYRGYRIHLHFDDWPDSPREWGNLGTIIYKHPRYSLGDIQIGGRDSEFATVDDARDFINRDDVISLPVYCYEHGAITINTSGYSCPWDSGQCGWIFVTKERLRKEYGVQRISKKIIETALEVMREEIKTFDTYIRGDVLGWEVLDKEDTDLPLESCWGYYSEEDALTDAHDCVDWMVKRALKEGVQPPLPTLEVHFPDLPDWTLNPEVA